MARKRIDSLLVKEAIEKELQFLAGNLDELAAKIKTFPAIRTKTEGAGNVKELSKAQIQYAESLKAVEQLVKQRMSSEAKLVTLQTDYARATATNRTEIQKMNREQKIAAEIALSQEGSIERARAKIKALTLEQSKLNLVTAEGRKRNDEINKSLDKYTEFIRKNVSAAEKQRMNVGNYQGSAKIIVDALERARQKVQQVEKDFGKIGPEAKAARGEFEALRRITEDGRFLNIAAKFGDTNKELRFFTQQLNALEDAGMKNSQVYADVRRRLAELTDQLGDTKAEIRALSSDTRNFDLFAGSVNFAADAFQTFAGAAALAGASEEEVAAQIRTLVAVQSVANGVKGIANELTTKGTAANKAYAFVQGLVSVAMDKTAASATRLNAAMGLVAIAATVIGAVVVAYTMFRKSADEAEKSQAAFNKATEIAIEKDGDRIASLQILIDKIKAGGLTQEQKTATLKEYNEKLGDTLGKYKTYQELEAALIANGPKYIAYLLSKARAEAAYGLLIDEYKKKFEKERTSAKEFTGFSLLGIFFDDETTYNADKAKALKQSDDEIATVRAIYQRTQDEMLKLEKELKIPEIKPDPKGQSNNSSDPDKQRLDYLKLQLEKEAAIQRQIVEIESFSFSERVQASRKYLEIKKQIIDAEYQYEINKKGATEAEIKAAESNRAQAISALSDEARGLFKSNIQEAVNSVKEEMGELPAEVTAVFDKMNAEFIEGAKNLLGELTEAQKAAIEKITSESDEKERLQEIKDTYIDTYQSIYSTIGELFANTFDVQKNRIQEQIDDIDRLKAAEIDRINASGDSEEKKAARVKLIEAKAQSDREALQRRQREIDRQKAIAQKAFNIFTISIDGIQQIIKLRLLATEARAKYLALGGPANPLAAGYGVAAALAQAQVFQAIIANSSALVAAAATPIPKFAGGKDASDPYEGPGIAGEAGRELHVSKSGKVSLIDKPTLLNLQKGDTILPNRVTEDMIRAAHGDRLQLMQLFTGGQPINDDTSKAIKEQTEILKRIEKKPSVIIQSHPSVETTAWYMQNLKN